MAFKTLIPTNFFFLFLAVFFWVPVHSQEVCDDFDCNSDILKIKLDVPLETTNPDQSRTDQFIAAYDKAKKIESKYPKKPAWRNEFKEGKVGGKSCLWHYFLKSQFAYEYEQNSAFAKYIDKQEPDVEAWKIRGFIASRHALSMQSRMNINCKRQVKKLENIEGPYLDNLPKVFRKLAEVQGYFDAEGNMIRSLEIPPEVVSLIKKVENIPLNEETNGQLDQMIAEVKDTQDKIGKLSADQNADQNQLDNLLSADQNLLPEGGKFKNLLGQAQKGLAALKAATSGLGGKAGNLLSGLGKLKDLFPNLLKDKEDLLGKLNTPGVSLEKANNLVNNFTKKVGDFENDLKDETLSKEQLEKELEDLLKEQTKVADQLNQVEKAVDQAKAEQQKEEEDKNSIAKIKDQLDNYNKDGNWKQQLADCEDDLKSTEKGIEAEEGKGKKFKAKLKKVLDRGAKLFSKLGDLKNIHDDLENGKIPDKRSLDSVAELVKKREKVEQQLAAQTRIQIDLEGKFTLLNGALDLLKNDLAKGLQDLGGLKTELDGLVGNKTDLLSKLDQPMAAVGEAEQLLQEFMKIYEQFDKKEKCKDADQLKNKLDELAKDFKNLKNKLDTSEEAMEGLDQAGVALETETQEIVKGVEEALEKVKEIETLKEEIKTELGIEVDPEPVTLEEWSDNFNVERTYWEAVFHPDREVVDGYVGKYFEVQLKDAEKSVKLLFGPGEYFIEKSDFRRNYGATIGTFVTEALYYLKKADEGKVKLFIQGSADITGHKTFRGNMDDRFLFEDIEVLPQKEGQENFFSNPENKDIPKNRFRNQHLPDLRAQYLADMIQVYSKKFDPILLEGSVKDYKDEGQRNAIIYLFFPEELLEED